MGSTGETQITPTEVSDEELSLFITQLASGSTLQMVLMASIELDLFKIIAKAGPGASVSPSYIASQLITSNPDTAEMLDRILRFLASHSILTYAQKNLPDGEVQHLYGLKPVCKYLIENEDGASIGPLCLLNQNKVLMESWYHLKDAVLNGGIPFNKAHGMSFDEYFSADKKFNQAYNKGMAAYSTFTMKNILETYKGFEDVSSVVHVGGGHGDLLRMIVSKYPSIKGINFDLPHVIRDAPQIRGVEHVEADMYVSVPAAGAVFMKWICYNWYDERCVKFLKNCYDVLPENGKVIVAEWIRPVAPDSSLATKRVMNIDVIMMAQNPGGKVRTEKEFEALAKDAGFQGFRVMCNAFGTYVMEFLKKPVY